MLKQWKSAAFELQVGIHELLGHGSGKLFYQDDVGGFNFDRSELKHPLHEGEGISTWYKPGETWDGVFGSLSSAYEECRAECTGVFLCDDPLALSIFGHEGEEGHTITYIPLPPRTATPSRDSPCPSPPPPHPSPVVCSYVNWLNMARAGLYVTADCSVCTCFRMQCVTPCACAASSSTRQAKAGGRRTCKGVGQSSG